MSDMALSDVRILDLTRHVAGPFCTKMLADYGADVIKVERPNGGDVTRRMGPFPDDVPHPEKSGLFLHLNTNKRGVTLNLKSATGKRMLMELVKQVDVVVENFAPRVLPSLGLAYEDLEQINPQLILVSISNFGQTGPYRDYKASEIVLHGMGGNLRSLGLPEREPVKYGSHVALRQAGLIGAAATMAALFTREARGEGEHVDVAIVETQAGSQDRRAPQLITAQFVNQVFPRRAPGATMASGTFPCKDGYVNVTGGGSRFPRALEMIGKPELIEDPRFATPDARLNPENSEDFNREVLMPWLMQHTMQEVWSIAQKARVLSGPIYTSEALMADNHFRDRGMWVDIDHPVAGRYTYPGRPIIMGESPWQLRRAAPQLGEHNEEVFGEALGYESQDLARLRGVGVI
jgi:crotonobetainyl-CoA:carnitine CoA-transferase CaiB-like acyl-CoA transferase